MKFIKNENDLYVVARRVSIHKKDSIGNLILPEVEGLTVESVAVGQDLDKNAKNRLFLYHGNSGLRFDSLNKEIGNLHFVHRRDIICYVEADDDEIIVDRIRQVPIVDPESEWIRG